MSANTTSQKRINATSAKAIMGNHILTKGDFAMKVTVLLKYEPELVEKHYDEYKSAYRDIGLNLRRLDIIKKIWNETNEPIDVCALRFTAPRYYYKRYKRIHKDTMSYIGWN